MPSIYRYIASGGGCDICQEHDGETGPASSLPQAPNPDCRNQFNCRCFLEFVSEDSDGCYCYIFCPGEYWDDECDCPDPNGCCCLLPDFSRSWHPYCECGAGGGSGDGDGEGGLFCEDTTDCPFADDVCCWFEDFGVCIHYDDCV